MCANIYVAVWSEGVVLVFNLDWLCFVIITLITHDYGMKKNVLGTIVSNDSTRGLSPCYSI